MMTSSRLLVGGARVSVEWWRCRSRSGVSGLDLFARR